jgi:hypothetical protein
MVCSSGGCATSRALLGVGASGSCFGNCCATGAVDSAAGACLAVMTGSTTDTGADAVAGLGQGTGVAIGDVETDDTTLPIAGTSSSASTGLASSAGGGGSGGAILPWIFAGVDNARTTCKSSAPSRLCFQGSLKPGRPKVWPPKVTLSNSAWSSTATSSAVPMRR